MSKFKAGDKVRKKDGSPWSNGDYIVTVSSRVGTSPDMVFSKETDSWSYEDCLELVESTKRYEDKWELNEGQDIPEDADKLYHGDSVVAFRRVKQPEWKFGDMLVGKNTGSLVVFLANHSHDAKQFRGWFEGSGCSCFARREKFTLMND